MLLESNELGVAKHDIDALLEFGKSFLDLADIVGDVMEDGKISLDDIGQLLKLSPIVAGMRQAPQAIKEIADLTEEEHTRLKNELVAYAETLKPDAGADKLEEIALNIITGASSIVLAVSKFL